MYLIAANLACFIVIIKIRTYFSLFLLAFRIFLFFLTLIPKWFWFWIKKKNFFYFILLLFYSFITLFFYYFIILFFKYFIILFFYYFILLLLSQYPNLFIFVNLSFTSFPLFLAQVFKWFELQLNKKLLQSPLTLHKCHFFLCSWPYYCHLESASRSESSLCINIQFCFAQELGSMDDSARAGWL